LIVRPFVTTDTVPVKESPPRRQIWSPGENFARESRARVFHGAAGLVPADVSLPFAERKYEVQKLCAGHSAKRAKASFLTALLYAIIEVFKLSSSWMDVLLQEPWPALCRREGSSKIDVKLSSNALMRRPICSIQQISVNRPDFMLLKDRSCAVVERFFSQDRCFRTNSRDEFGSKAAYGMAKIRPTVKICFSAPKLETTRG